MVGQCSLVVFIIKEVVAAYNFLRVNFSLNYQSTVSQKRLVGHIVDALLPMLFYRSVYSDGPVQDLLVRIRKISRRRKWKLSNLNCILERYR